MAKVYVAGKFEEKEYVRSVQQSLRLAGHTITHDWTVEDATGMTGKVLEDYMRKAAELDYMGVKNADIVLVLNHAKAFGTMTEMGLGLAWGKRIMVVQPNIRTNIFFHLPEVQLFDEAQWAVDVINQYWPVVK